MTAQRSDASRSLIPALTRKWRCSQLRPLKLLSATQRYRFSGPISSSYVTACTKSWVTSGTPPAYSDYPREGILASPVSGLSPRRRAHMKKFLAGTIVVLAALSPAGSAQASTAGQRNALNKAQSYLSYTAFSKSGLVKQLKFEHFSTSAALLAVYHVRVSGNPQAVKKANSYLSYSSFSRQGLIKQLEFEGFTPSQAAYGVRKAYH